MLSSLSLSFAAAVLPLAAEALTLQECSACLEFCPGASGINPHLPIKIPDLGRPFEEGPQWGQLNPRPGPNGLWWVPSLPGSPAHNVAGWWYIPGTISNPPVTGLPPNFFRPVGGGSTPSIGGFGWWLIPGLSNSQPQYIGPGEWRLPSINGFDFGNSCNLRPDPNGSVSCSYVTPGVGGILGTMKPRPEEPVWGYLQLPWNQQHPPGGFPQPGVLPRDQFGSGGMVLEIVERGYNMAQFGIFVDGQLTAQSPLPNQWGNENSFCDTIQECNQNPFSRVTTTIPGGTHRVEVRMIGGTFRNNVGSPWIGFKPVFWRLSPIDGNFGGQSPFKPGYGSGQQIQVSPPIHDGGGGQPAYNGGGSGGAGQGNSGGQDGPRFDGGPGGQGGNIDTDTPPIIGGPGSDDALLPPGGAGGQGGGTGTGGGSGSDYPQHPPPVNPGIVDGGQGGATGGQGGATGGQGGATGGQGGATGGQGGATGGQGGATGGQGGATGGQGGATGGQGGATGGQGGATGGLAGRNPGNQITPWAVFVMNFDASHIRGQSYPAPFRVPRSSFDRDTLLEVVDKYYQTCHYKLYVDGQVAGETDEKGFQNDAVSCAYADDCKNKGFGHGYALIPAGNHNVEIHWTDGPKTSRSGFIYTHNQGLWRLVEAA